MERLTEIHDILNKMQFFNQRSGRELWNDKPTSVQDEDIANRDRDIEEVREFINNIVEQLKVENQGLLLKLSCNVGDTVYTNFSMQGWYMRKKDRPYKAKIVFVGINGEDNFMNVDLGKGAMLSFKFSEIGKTVFLTEQEAQAALEKMKGE